jgi:hypothetical protein
MAPPALEQTLAHVNPRTDQDVGRALGPYVPMPPRSSLSGQGTLLACEGNGCWAPSPNVPPGAAGAISVLFSNTAPVVANVGEALFDAGAIAEKVARLAPITGTLFLVADLIEGRATWTDVAWSLGVDVAGIAAVRLAGWTVRSIRGARAATKAAGAVDDVAEGLLRARGTSFGAGSLGAGGVKILQRGGHTITAETAKALNELAGTNLARREWGKLLEMLKRTNGFGNSHHGAITSTGDYLDDTGAFVDNLLEYLP